MQYIDDDIRSHISEQLLLLFKLLHITIKCSPSVHKTPRKRYDDVDDHHMCQNFILLSVIIIISS